MSKAKREAGDVLVRAYLLGQPVHKIASVIKIDRVRACTLLRLGEGSVSQILDGE